MCQLQLLTFCGMLVRRCCSKLLLVLLQPVPVWGQVLLLQPAAAAFEWTSDTGSISVPLPPELL